MTDPDPEAERRRRQAPRYGEYATPEEVAEIRGPDAPPLVPVEPAPPPPPSGRPVPGPPPAGHARGAGWDTLATFGLLAFGTFDVIRNVIGFLNLRGTLASQFQALGYGDIDVPAAIDPWGYVLIAVNVLLLVGAGVLAVRRLRHGRIAFWVPLVAGIVAALIGGIVVASVLGASGALGVLQNQG